MISHAFSLNDWVGFAISRHGPILSHLFFADGIILFGEASLHQANIMLAILNKFCNCSGQKINVSKSLLFFSPNTSSTSARRISCRLGFPLTRDLSLYLGMPLVHSRLSSCHFNFLFSKFQRKFSGWIKCFLSMARCAVLVKVVLLAIPHYQMQLILLPKRLLHRLEKIIWDFFWDNSPQSKLYPVAWSVICKDNLAGGLSFSSLHNINRTTLVKLGWRFLYHLHSLWVKVLKAKYGHMLIHKKLSSLVWHSITKVSELVHHGVKWQLW